MTALRHRTSGPTDPGTLEFGLDGAPVAPFAVDHTGAISFGDGVNPRDVVLQRTAAGVVAIVNGVLVPTVDVRRYGASTAATDNSPAFQAALNSAGNNAVVYIPGGRWTCLTTLTKSGFTGLAIVGDGSDVTFIQGPGSAIILDIGTTDTGYDQGFTLAGLTVARSIAGGAPAVRLRKLDASTITNCKISAGTNSLDISQCVALKVVDSHIVSQTVNAIRMDNSDQVSIARCFFETNFSTTATHIYLDSGNKAVSIDDNVFSTAQYVLKADGGPSNNVAFTGNVAENVDYGMQIAPVVGASGGWSVVGNCLLGKSTAGTFGIRLYGANHTVVGNSLLGFTTASIDEAGAEPRYNLVSGNRCDAPVNVTSTGSVVGPNLGVGSMRLPDGATITAGTASGLQLGTATNQKLGLWGATPVVRPTGTPAAATDLASVITLANSLRSSLLAIGAVG